VTPPTTLTTRSTSGWFLDRRTQRFEVVDVDDGRCALLSPLFDLGLGGVEICGNGTQGDDVGAGVGEPVTHRGTNAATTSAHDEGSAAGERDLDRHVCIVAHGEPDFDLEKRTHVRVRCEDGLLGDHEIEHFRRSLAMLPAGADALKREEAMVLLGRLRDATARLRRVEAGLQELLDTELGDGAAR
jgi:hypothetical protein